MRLLCIGHCIDKSSLIKKNLKKKFLVDFTATGARGMGYARKNQYDVLIIDYHLPDTAGTMLCQKLRQENIHIPILIISNQFHINQKIASFDAGADEYLAQPLDVCELEARLKALSRRLPEIKPTIIRVGKLTLDLNSKQVEYDHQPIILRKKEWLLLEYLMSNAHKILTRAMILLHVWHKKNNFSTNTVDVHIKYLRDKIDHRFGVNMIKTLHGMGYQIRPEVPITRS